MTLTSFYILQGHTPVKCDTIDEWVKFNSKDGARIVARTELDSYLISTVFLGMNHRWGEGEPILFETMIFDPKGGSEVTKDGEEYQERYCTWEQAEKGHERAILFLNEKLGI